MVMEDIIQSFNNSPVYVMELTELDELLSKCEIKFEKDTLISSYIRILKYKKFFLTQEKTTKGEIVLRLFSGFDEAEALVNDHLKTYDQMWDGCGCKINYYA